MSRVLLTNLILDRLPAQLDVRPDYALLAAHDLTF